jgi:glutamate-1-semialdehyde 2,1-aminomutase
MKPRPISESIYSQLCEVIPGGVNSPVRAFKGLDATPLVAEKGVGDLIYDVDGNSYIDFCGSWGALLHGHAHPYIIDAAIERTRKGTSFGITTPIEEQLARKIIEHNPSVQKIRFVSSGTEATMSAIRLMRGFTGKEIIIKFTGNYHGHSDFLLVKAGSGLVGLNPESSSAGVPQDSVKNTVCLPFNDVETCRNIFYHPVYRNKIAGVIIEPVAGNMGVVPATKEFMQMLREETSKAGALLIFDEVMTGFRVGLKSAQGMYGITPDLSCFAKIIGGGFPAAAFGGRKDIMDYLAPLGPVYQAGTLSGNPVAMEAGLASLKLAEMPGVYEELDRKTALICDPVADRLKQKNLNACVQRVGSMMTIFWGARQVSCMEDAQNLDAALFAKFFRYMFEEGIYIPPAQHEAWFVSTVHTEEHLVKTRDAILKFLE